jgi:tRNA(Ile)-lysidine synthase
VSAASPLPERVESFLQQQGIAVDGIVVAVSGGADSTALARCLAVRAGGGALVLAHLNHQLRGRESDADEEFVRALHGRLECRAPGVRLRCERVNVRAEARKRHENLEAVARCMRYAWLAGVARDEGMTLVGTGHTADDQAETVLHRLLRGAGLRGLRGIAPWRMLDDGVHLIRPMLRVRRTQVLEYLQAEGEGYREDSSNRDPRYLRNRIRHELLPRLVAEFNPEIVAILGGLASQARTAYRLEHRTGRRLLGKAELPRAGRLLVFDATHLAGAKRAAVRSALRLAWRREGWPMAAMSYAHWDRLAGLAQGEASALDMPGGIRALWRGRVVQLGPPP